jgi:hypothetical protein
VIRGMEANLLRLEAIQLTKPRNPESASKPRLEALNCSAQCSDLIVGRVCTSTVQAFSLSSMGTQYLSLPPVHHPCNASQRPELDTGSVVRCNLFCQVFQRVTNDILAPSCPVLTPTLVCALKA